MALFRRAATTEPTPIDGVDCLYLDLDGVVYKGPDALPHAVDSIRSIDVRSIYLTNNASRTDADVAEHLSSFGLDVQPEEVVTSPQAAMRLLAAHLEPGDPVLVVGGAGIVVEVEARGWRVVRTAAEQPKAVVQGFHPSVGWEQLAQASFALHTGIPWVATNGDWTIPVAGGIAPGNGTLVSAVHTAVGRLAEFAGKPERHMYDVATERFGAQTPAMVGDRLDTDILGARRAGIRSIHVLTGVDRGAHLIGADESMRPDHVIADLRGLTQPILPIRETHERSTGDTYFEVGRAAVRRSGIDITLVRAGDAEVDTIRAACAAVWTADRPVLGLRVADELLAL
ncbi:HAD-IIA family hydrolase [Agrococcus carbonis]|uniref:Haloacid Dehalogenase Superfamily Class (Subfamily) IIA/haloacid dehalogenase superfamily, subfamily IA, variant 1 with third motif having Dx(3-4)D or Dx(3-4)E n=1 Tax=Agrococcus carbonis TaxID=684552 RepID=A0A1H1SMV1_9MICO|nr:HAD-IIA family hydrolase [Agrococcus carbonis]SDS49334.1 Haloacid Dehalogenase Superfamily Class (subfamily) IIA/haloacid dehalogenase superfamily, subfamily IA, variant 1 with third motif having Dx(3-4)D or Dx(3-4)E [Agrococcus carbonis]